MYFFYKNNNVYIYTQYNTYQEWWWTANTAVNIEHIHEADVSLRSGVELAYLRDVEPLPKISVDVWAEPVSNRRPNFVVCVLGALEIYRKASFLSYVLI